MPPFCSSGLLSPHSSLKSLALAVALAFLALDSCSPPQDRRRHRRDRIGHQRLVRSGDEAGQRLGQRDGIRQF